MAAVAASVVVCLVIVTMLGLIGKAFEHLVWVVTGRDAWFIFDVFGGCLLLLPLIIRAACWLFIAFAAILALITND